MNKSACVTRNTASAIVHIITNSVINAEFKTHISDHFPIFFIFRCIVDSTEAWEEFIYKQNYSRNSIETFKQKLCEVNWNKVKQSNMQTNLTLNFPRYALLCMKNVFLSSKLG